MQNTVAADTRFLSPAFPRTSRYHPDWIAASISGGANSLWLTEWLTGDLNLQPGMRVLDLGCGRAASSIFLHHEFGVQVWATDLWFSASENQQRIHDANADHAVFPVHANARDLPFAANFFDAIISIDSFSHYATDDLYLNYLARFVKPGGQIAFAGAGLVNDIEAHPPEHLRGWWTPELWSFHTPQWWRKHWERTGIVDIQLADTMPHGWQRWLDWHRTIAPDNLSEIEALEADQGRYLGYIRLIARRLPESELAEPIISVRTKYTRQPLLRDQP